MAVILEGIVFVLLGIIAWRDSRTMEISDEWNLAVAVCGVAAMFIEPEILIKDRLLGAICVSLPMYLMILWIPESFGGGDVKLTFAMGLYLGVRRTLTGTFLAILIGGLYAVYLLASGKAKAGEGAHMAFGPALCIGFVVSRLWGDQILSWYFQLFY